MKHTGLDAISMEKAIAEKAIHEVNKKCPYLQIDHDGITKRMLLHLWYNLCVV
ncbi:hypothetical protein BS78_K247000 [Paspalum vaginatum]|uniref:Uncharacterized protein n=1 Tax=Paspalum vaginatum TaxID=158149 RepID=A0A9W7X7Y2_9POAL|nr:hypothetical protein BS78_K247000 [Paspalum vaginatum]